MSSSIRTLVSSFAILSAIISLKQVIDIPPNQCYMTYMPSVPRYVPIQLPENVTKKFPHYNLYVYAEGSLAEEIYHSIPTGIPILFIHGNSGNRGQARSLASILQLKSELYNGYQPVYSIYTVDFHEESSALYGGILPRQTEFLHEVLRAITKNWNKVHPKEPFKVVLVGHSMGGVVARSLYLEPDFDISTVALHVELASPTARPVFFLDRGLWEFYERVTELWKQVGHVLPPVLSIMGGERDLQVRSSLGDSPQGLKTLSESVPLSWASSDHLCIVWCKQLQLALSRTLLDVAYSIDDREKIIKIINYHMTRKYALHNSLLTLPKLPRSIEFQQGRDWQEKFEGSWRFNKKKTIAATSFVIPVYKELHISIVAYGIRNDDWLFGCTKLKRDGKLVSCLTGVDISRKNALIPPLYKGQDMMFESSTDTVGRVYHISPQEIATKKFEAIVLSVPALLENVVILGERYLPKKRVSVFDTNAVFSGFFSKKTMVSMHLSERSVYQQIILTNFQHIWKAYTIKVHSKLCMDGTTGVGYARFRTDWSAEDKFYKLRAHQDALTTFTIKLHSTPNHQEEHNSTLEFYFDSDCSYDVHLQFDLKSALGQLILHYGEGLLAYCFAFVLVVLARQLADLGRLGVCFNFGTSLEHSSTFFALTAIPTIIESMAFMPPPPPPLAPYLSRPQRTVSSVESLVIRVLLYALALGTVSLAAKLLEFFLSVVSAIYIRTKRYMRASWDDPQSVPQYNENKTSRYLTAALVATLAISMSIGGGVGFVVTAVVHFIQLLVVTCQNNFLEDRKGASGFSSRWKLQSSLLLLQILCLPLYVPSLVVWLKTFEALPNDPYLFSAPITTFFATTVAQPNVPHPNRYYYRSTGYFVFFLAVLCVLVCQEALFRLCYFQLVIFGLLFFQQNFKP